MYQNVLFVILSKMMKMSYNNQVVPVKLTKLSPEIEIVTLYFYRAKIKIITADSKLFTYFYFQFSIYLLIIY